MSSAKRRQRKERAKAREAEVTGDTPAPPSQVNYDWRTFPVFFAFAGGGFLSLVIGVATGALGLTVTFAVFGGMLGFGVSRLGTRALVSRGIIKPRG